jgi:hypothetical protein
MLPPIKGEKNCGDVDQVCATRMTLNVYERNGSSMDTAATGAAQRWNTLIHGIYYAYLGESTVPFFSEGRIMSEDIKIQTHRDAVGSKAASFPAPTT